MKRYATVEHAVNLIVEMFESRHLTCNIDSFRNKIYNFYINSDITDPEILAAAALMEDDWFYSATYAEMLDAKEQFRYSGFIGDYYEV